jgi:hypothetical protein
MATAVSLRVGQHVRVRALRVGGHVRTPWYVQGRFGVIVGALGRWPNPEICALGLVEVDGFARRAADHDPPHGVGEPHPQIGLQRAEVEVARGGVEGGGCGDEDA